MPVKFVNNFETTLTAGILTSSTSISIADGSPLSGLIGSGNTMDLTLENGDDIEIVEATAQPSTNTLTITRAQDGTSAIAFPTGTRVSNRLTRERLQAMQEQVEGGGGGGGGAGVTRTLYDGTAIAAASGNINHTIGENDLVHLRSDAGVNLTFRIRMPASPGTTVYHAVVVFDFHTGVDTASMGFDLTTPNALLDNLFFNGPASIFFPDSVPWTSGTVVYDIYVSVISGTLEGTVLRRTYS